MAQRFSISSKQAVLIGFGATALIAGTVMIVLHNRKKKQQQIKATPKNTKTLMV